MTNEELCTEARKSKKALNLLYEQNQGLINKICRKISGQFEIEYEEAVQGAAFGFMDAVKNHEPESGVKFSTFLARCVFNAIKEYVKQEKRQAEKCPILTYTEFDPDTYKINIFNPVDSDEITLYPIEFNEYHLTPEEAFFVKYKRETVRNAVKNLDERHRQDISFRFGLEDDIEHGKSETATANSMDCSLKSFFPITNPFFVLLAPQRIPQEIRVDISALRQIRYDLAVSIYVLKHIRYDINSPRAAAHIECAAHIERAAYIENYRREFISLRISFTTDSQCPVPGKRSTGQAFSAR